MLTAVVVLAVATVGLVVVKPGPVAGWLGEDAAANAAPTDPPEPTPGPVLAAVDTGAPMPSPEGMKSALDPVIAQAGIGGSINVSVRDVATGEVLYGRGAEAPTTPASTMKLVTAVTVLAARGPAHRIPTRVVAGPNPGEVVLVGGGDPTLSVDGKPFYPGAARLDRLAAQVKAALGSVAPTKVYYDSSLYSGPVFGPGWDADIPTGGFAGASTALMTNGARVSVKKTENGYAERYTKPDQAAAQAFAKALGVKAQPAPAPAGSVPPDNGAASPATVASGGPPSPGAELARVESPPMIRLVEFMLADSDNVVAEALARQVAIARGEPASFAGAKTAETAVLGELGLPTKGLVLADGSGLSRTDRLTPEALTGLLAFAASGKRPELTGIFAGLPVAAWSGTLDDRFGAAADRKSAAGAVRAKTGTLTGVHAMSGIATTADGRLVSFAVLSEGVGAGQEAAQAAIDRIAATIAACGCA